MIVALEGEVTKKEPTFVYVKLSSGITHLIYISLNCSSLIDKKFVQLHITQIIKEDSNNLFGFIELLEKTMFDRVIKINGVGPSTAMAICSTFTPSSFTKAISNQNIEAFKRVPGIGPKSAKRILVELGDFDLGLDASANTSTNHVEAIQALESLGFKRDKIQKVLTKCNSYETADIIKEALKKLT